MARTSPRRGIAALAIAPSLVFAQQGVLEVPGQYSWQSGIGVISGWHCSGQRIEISINGGAKILAGSHTPRDDAAGICGRSDTGFSLLFSWNLLPPTDPTGEIGSVPYHRVTAYADGIQFAESKVQVAKFGYWTQHLTGKSGKYTLRNFPDPGRTAQVTWDEDKQNFSITKTDGLAQPTDTELGGTGTYYGAVQVYSCSSGPASPPTVRNAKFIVKTDSGQMQLKLEYADGMVCQLPVVPVLEASIVYPRSEGFARARFDEAATASCADFAGKAIDINVNGKLIESSLIRGCSTLVTGATFRSFP